VVTAMAWRIALLGGDGRDAARIVPGRRVRVFRGHRYGGNGELRRLERAIKSGGIELLFIHARWNGHSATARAIRLCRKYKIAFRVLSR